MVIICLALHFHFCRLCERVVCQGVLDVTVKRDDHILESYNEDVYEDMKVDATTYR